MIDTDEKLKKILEGSLDLEPATHHKLFLTLTILLICVVSTCANILILLATSKYEDRKTATIIYLRNFVICDTFYIIAITIEYEMRSYSLNELSSEINCGTLSIANTIRSIDVLFLVLLVNQWFFQNTRVKLFETHPHFLSLCLWLLMLLQIVSLLTTCSMTEGFEYGEYLLQFSMMCFNIFLCVFMTLRKCANPFSTKVGSLPIAMANALPCFWFTPLLISFAALYLKLESPFFRTAIQVIDMLVFLYPTVTFYMCCRMDRDFKTGLKKAFGKDASGGDRSDFSPHAQVNIEIGPVDNPSFTYKLDES